jgi:para-nitrobenzyl esterase
MRTLTAGLSGLAIALAVTGAATAQSTPSNTAAMGSMAPAEKPTVDKTTIADLLANPAAKAVVDKDLPGLTADPRLQQAMGMTLKDIEPYSEGKIDDAALTKVQQDFDAISSQ